MSNVRDFGAIGDGRTDSTEAVLHAIRQGDGALLFPRGDYIISRTIEVPLDRTGRVAIDGFAGTAKVIMTGPGPVFQLVGTHAGTASPQSVRSNVWERERMPTVKNIEIEGRHNNADGIECAGTMQLLVEGAAFRGLRHAIRLSDRNRNVTISHCHIYHNRGAGVFLDNVNLHQINIVGCHISYNRLGGVRVVGSEVRNLQITGNDIEYNNHRTHDQASEPTAEVYIDATGTRASVAEVTIASNTLQATPSHRGANIRIIGDPDRPNPPGLWTITGNVIGSQHDNVHLTGCAGVSITGNSIYSCEHRNLLAENCRQLVLGSNNFRRHTEDMGMGARLVDSEDCIIHGCHFLDESEEGQESGASPLELVNCRGFNITGCQILDGVPFGIHLENCSHANLTANTVRDRRPEKRTRAAIRWSGEGRANLLAANTVGEGADATLDIDDAANVQTTNNLLDA